jgi:hypothetical protein
MKVTSLDKAARARAAALEREQQRVAMERARNMRADEPLVALKVHVLKPGKRNEGETCTLKLMHACTHARIHAHAHVCMSMQTTRQVHVQSHTPQHAFTCSPSLWNGKCVALEQYSTASGPPVKSSSPPPRAWSSTLTQRLLPGAQDVHSVSTTSTTSTTSTSHAHTPHASRVSSAAQTPAPTPSTVLPTNAGFSSSASEQMPQTKQSGIFSDSEEEDEEAAKSTFLYTAHPPSTPAHDTQLKRPPPPTAPRPVPRTAQRTAAPANEHGKGETRASVMQDSPAVGGKSAATPASFLSFLDDEVVFVCQHGRERGE